MPDWKAETRAQLGEVIRELEAIQYRLLGIAASLGAQEDRVQLIDEEKPDEKIDTRSVIECVLVDRTGPAIRDLVAARKVLREPRRKHVE